MWDSFLFTFMFTGALLAIRYQPKRFWIFLGETILIVSMLTSPILAGEYSPAGTSLPAKADGGFRLALTGDGSPKMFTSESENRKRVSVNRLYVENLFEKSKPVFNQLKAVPQYSRLSWSDLTNVLYRMRREHVFNQSTMESALAWVNLLKNDASALNYIYNSVDSNTPNHNVGQQVYTRYLDSWITPGQRAMWRHCKNALEGWEDNWRIDVVSGFRSPAFEAIVFSQYPGPLVEAMKQKTLPGFGGHQSRIPDITVCAGSVTADDTAIFPWRRVNAVCGEFGFTALNLKSDTNYQELGFSGINALYQPILSNKLIPHRTSKPLINAMKETEFYPSPDGLRMLIALSAQESSIRWNPRLNKQKKRYLRARFNRFFERTETAFSGVFTKMLLSAEHQVKKKKIVDDLIKITDPTDKSVYEYDFYLWTLDVKVFFSDLLAEYKNFTRLGEWFFELEKAVAQIEYEPQTFGLWQVNVNLLIEKVEASPKLKREFGEIYKRVGDDWKVDRHELVIALSGLPYAKLSRQKTLELLFRTYIKPRYDSHVRGDENDLLYFLAENISGEMSTYRAAIQRRLNDILKLSLVLDGDLSFYIPYSLRIDWERQSNTQNALDRYLKSNPALFPDSTVHQTLIHNLCQADTWEKLQRSELYISLMGEEFGGRMFPSVSSGFYQQTARQYASIVKRKSRLF